MLVIQIVAATLLLLGSVIIFRALLAIDLADPPREAARPRLVRRLRREALGGAADTERFSRAA